MSRTVKMLGCQDVMPTELRQGKVILNSGFFSQANPNRNLVYFFKWKTLDQTPNEFKQSSVYVVVER